MTILSRRSGILNWKIGILQMLANYRFIWGVSFVSDQIVSGMLNCDGRYARWVLVILLVLIALTVFLGLIGNFTLAKFILAGVGPLTPAFALGIREYKEHNKYAAQLDKLKEYVESLWNKALSGADPDELTRDSRTLQDEIYNLRRTSLLIFDWVYRLLRKEDEKLMNTAADEMVKKALEFLRG